MKTNRYHTSIISITIILIAILFIFNEGRAYDEFPIATTTGREMAFNAAFDGTNYLVGLQGDQNSNHNITAQLVSQSGTLVGSRISGGGTGGAQVVAFDGTNYLMVWQDMVWEEHSTHIYGQFISKAGTLVGSQITFRAGSYMSSILNLLFDGTNYFVVWENRVADYESDTADVYGQFITPSGTLLGSAIPVSTVAHGQRDPTLAFDGTNILVVWTDGRNQSACYTDLQGTHCYESDIYGQFITKSSSSSAGTLFGTNFAINTSTLPRDGSGPAIAFDGTNYLITFPEETTLPNACPTGGCKWDIYGQLVTKTGALIGPKITIINTSPDHFLPGCVFNGTNYLVTWTEGFGSISATVKGRFFDTSGSPDSSEFTLFSPSGGRVPWFASTIFNGLKYFSVINRGTPGTDPSDVDSYTNQDVYGAFINPSAETVVTPGEGTFGTEITIIGSNFGSKKGKVLIGSTPLTILDWADVLIHCRLTKVLDPGVYDVTIQPKEPKGAAPIIEKNAFTAKAAEIDSIEQGEGSAYDQVTIKGKFFGTKKGKVYLEYEGGENLVRKACKVLSWTMDPTTGDSEIVFVVPKMLPEVCDVVVDPYVAIPETEEEDAFTVKAPEIVSVEPGSGSVGGQITISGNYFGSKKPKVYLGYVSNGKPVKKSCSVVSWSDEEIIFTVPKLPVGTYDVIVTNSVSSDTLPGGFIIK